MKKNFKKMLSILLATLMLCSIFSICVSAAPGPHTITLGGGNRTLNGTKYEAEFNQKIKDLAAAASEAAGETVTTFQYTDGSGVVYTVDMVNNVITFETDAKGVFYFPEYFFELTGHVQEAWGTQAGSNMGTNKTGKKQTVTGDKTYYGRYTQNKYTVKYVPGALADATNSVQQQTGNTYGKKITIKDNIFTRAGYIQIGWAYTENSAKIDVEALTPNFPVTDNIDLYPVWQKVKNEVKYDADAFRFTTVCEDYSEQTAQTFTITNNGNANVKLTLPTASSFVVSANGSLTIPANGGKVEISVRPVLNLAAGTYEEELAFNFGIDEINFTLKASFAVLEHRFENYKSNDNATYEADGTETASCIFGCGATDERPEAGSKKVFDIANNTVKGLLREYLYHKTVDCVAYGSGIDYTDEEIENAVANGATLERYRPVKWYVNEEHNGEFADGNYKINYVHTDFGQYVLTITYVNEKYVDGEWVATDVEDEKSFNYSIGPSAKDEVEVVRPNMIVNIIFALMGYLVDVIGGLLG